MRDILSLKNSLVTLLNNKKIENIVEFDLSNNNNKLSDYCIIGSGTSSRHTQAVIDNICIFLKDKKIFPNISGTTKSGWIMMEVLGIEIHLFKPDVRTYYDLESIMAY